MGDAEPGAASGSPRGPRGWLLDRVRDYFLGRPRRAPYEAPFVAAATLLPVLLLREVDLSTPGGVRTAVRFLGPAFLTLGFFPLFLLEKFRLSWLSRGEALRLAAVFRGLAIAYQLLLAADLLLLAAVGAKVAVFPLWQEALLDVVLALLAAVLVVHAHWLNAIDFQAFRRLSREGIEAPIAGTPTSFKLLDSVDIRILAIADRCGGEVSRVLLDAGGIGERETVARLQKLVFLGYLAFERDRHGYRFSLSAQGLDVLNLPASLFATSIDDPAVVRKLAQIRHLLSRERGTEVVVESAKLLEHVLRQRIVAAEPAIEEIGGKPFERATLGELIGHAQRTRLTDRFEDLVLNAVNTVRSGRVVHAASGASRGGLDDAYLVQTLTEVALKSLFARG
jgi:hypothetical protein